MYLVPGGVPGPGVGVPGPGDVPGPGGCTWSQGGVPGPRGGGVPDPRGVCTWGVYLVPGGVCFQGSQTPPNPRGQNDTHE